VVIRMPRGRHRPGAHHDTRAHRRRRRHPVAG
jgi:hypothetical protein